LQWEGINMTLVKINQDIVQVIGREQDHFTILTREREVKRVSASQINSVNKLDIKKELKDIRKQQVIYLPEYKRIKRYYK
jgi:hypothetical protein